MYMMHSCPLSHIYGQLLKSIIFRVKNIFEPNVLKLVINTIFIGSSPFAFLIINVKILSNFQYEWCAFGRKKRWLKKTKTIHFQNLHWTFNFFDLCQVLNMKFFQLMENIQKNLWKSNYYVSLMIFQTYKNIVLKNVQSFGWLF
jgi:hypothetical protein